MKKYSVTMMGEYEIFRVIVEAINEAEASNKAILEYENTPNADYVPFTKFGNILVREI